MEKKFKRIQLPEELKDFYHSLKEVQNSFSGENVFKTIRTRINEEDFNMGIPLLNILGLKANYRLLIKYLKKMCEFIGQDRPILNEEIQKIEMILKYKKDKFWPIIESFLWQKDDDFIDFCKNEGLNKEVFYLIVLNTLRPLIFEVAKGLENLINNNSIEKINIKENKVKWQQNYCPVCGWHPSIASIETLGNQRFLYCTLCSSKWFYQQLTCVSCKNHDQSKLGFIRTEQLDGYQIEVCKECNSYIKTVFTPNKFFSQEIIQLIDFDTIFLDIIAESKGFIKQGNNYGNTILN